MTNVEIGAINAILAGINTLKDGSVKITLEVNPDEQQVLNKLLNSYLTNQRLFTVAFIRMDDNG